MLTVLAMRRSFERVCLLVNELVLRCRTIGIERKPDCGNCLVPGGDVLLAKNILPARCRDGENHRFVGPDDDQRRSSFLINADVSDVGKSDVELRSFRPDIRQVIDVIRIEVERELERLEDETSRSQHEGAADFGQITGSAVWHTRDPSIDDMVLWSQIDAIELF